MVFASHTFLAIVLATYWLVGRRDQRLGKPLPCAGPMLNRGAELQFAAIAEARQAKAG